MGRGATDEATFHRTFACLDADLLDRVLGVWAATRLAVVQGLRVISLDGKSLRGARCGTGRARHLVAALCGTTTLGQVGVDAKSNEIPAVRDLLETIDVADAVVTVGAMHTQTQTAAAIRGAGAHYVFTVKANNKHLYAQLEALPWKHVPGPYHARVRPRPQRDPHYQDRPGPGVDHLRGCRPGGPVAPHHLAQGVQGLGQA